MNRTLLLLTTAVFCAFTPAAMAQKVHAVLIADTNDDSIGPGIVGNLKLMKSLLNQAKTVGQIDMDVHVVAGSDFNCTNINKAVDGLNVGPTDTVLFYYSAHGYRTPQTPTKFPDFDCKRAGNIADAKAGMSATVAALSAKNPQFIVAIADTCNIVLQRPPGVSERSAPLVAAAAWRRLFLRYKGKLLMSGSLPGQFSFYRNDELASGLFTRQFVDAVIDTMQKVADEENPELARWSSVYRSASRPFPIDPPYLEQAIQQPQGEKVLSVLPK